MADGRDGLAFIDKAGDEGHRLRVHTQPVRIHRMEVRFGSPDFRCPAHTYLFPDYIRWSFDAEVAEGADHLALGYGGGGEQEGFAGGVGFVEDVVAVVEVVELLRQLEGVLGEVGRLGRGDALLDDEGEFRDEQPGLPEATSLFAVEDGREIERGEWPRARLRRWCWPCGRCWRRGRWRTGRRGRSRPRS